MKVPLYNQAGERLQEIDVSDVLFGVEGHDALIHSAVVRHLANGRQGTLDTKTRGEVSGGGRKPWRQKGTGRARAGSSRSPLWRGGGVVFGPHPRDFSLGMPRQARRLALRAALSAKARDGQVAVVQALSFSEPKTRMLVQALDGIAPHRTTLLVTAEKDHNVVLSARNVPGIRAIEARNLNVYDVVKHEQVLLTQDALTRLQEVLVS
ncbi:MAG: 50S ribosomal protein L4 [Bacillota bacterium]|nr:50S ribosomal protein L4 [Bacillota bacterium]